MAHWAAAYWSHGAKHVPSMTGALAVMDGSDVKAIAAELGLALPLKDVLDVGCGTGRVARLCSGYLGVDISRSAVDYCLEHGVSARLLSGAGDLEGYGRFETVLCLSMFTHIGRTERVEYLEQFAGLSDRLLVDIIPGDGGGDVALWTADPKTFMTDLKSCGWKVVKTLDRSWDTPPAKNMHRYFLCGKR